MTTLLAALLLAASIFSVPSRARTLFPFEHHQLTREYVASLPEEDRQLFAFADETFTSAAPTPDKRCRYGPQDGKWPSDKAWQKLAKQLSPSSSLIKTTPQASVCYGSTKDAAKCQEITKNWNNSYMQMEDPVEVLSPVYQGLTCLPPTVFDSVSCTLGGYPSYVIKAKDVLDIQVGLNFARNDYVRLVVKNTGHDFVGRSAGAGSLSIWTHSLKDIMFFDNYIDDSGYRGPAVKAGAGVQAFELYKAANEKGLVVVGGEGQTVGIMGGFVQGGGHSPLSSLYGMAADHVLGFEVVAPSGEFLTANSTSNPDLFWALRGGGGSTFGIVTSVTVKVFKDMPVTAATWTFDSAKLGIDKFWAAVKAFFDRTIDNVDAGTYTYFQIMPNSNGKDYTFIMKPFFAPNKTAKDTNTILAPLFSRLTSLNIPFSPRIAEYKTFYSAWQSEFPLESAGDVQSAFASRLLPRSNFESETGRNITFSTLRQTIEAGHFMIAVGTAPTLARGGNPDNAVNPAWRTAVIHTMLFRRYDPKESVSSILALRASLTNVTMQKWRDITPGSGSYVNEADRLEPNWQQSFWGSKYEKLLAIKKDWDPKDVLWVVNAVGSEGWFVESVDGLPNENGRLCKANGGT